MSHVIASFKHECDADRCAHYARGRYPDAGVELHASHGGKFPHSVCMREIVGGDRQLAVAFIKGFAYALGAASLITEVMCRGDERERYDGAVA